jgi:hypothetical protein
MGDPTLRMHIVTPPSNFTAVLNGGSVDLAWTASPDASSGYHVYRATSEAGTTSFASLALKLLSLVFPNYQLFNVTDVAIQGQAVGFHAIGSLAGLSLFYVVLYTLLSWIVFSDKEF